MESLKARLGDKYYGLREVFTSHRYQRLRQQDHSGEISSPLSPNPRLRFTYPPRWSFKYLVIVFLASLMASALVLRSLIRPSPVKKSSTTPPPPPRFPWQTFPRETGYYDGLRRLTPSELGHPDGMGDDSSRGYPLPVEYNPYHFSTDSESSPAEQCFLDVDGRIPPPAIWAYNGVTEHAPEPMLGSYDALDLRKDVCFDRYGRYGPYGFGYEMDQGGTGLGMRGDTDGTEMILHPRFHIDWRKVDLGRAQTICRQKNEHRFSNRSSTYTDDVFHHAENWPGSSSSTPSETATSKNSHIPRTAIVLRLWDTYKWTNYSDLYIRSLVSELNLNTGAEYDIHMLIQIKDGSPIFASDKVYNAVLDRVVPAEYRPMATLWSEDLMELLYPGPFEPQFQRPGPIHSVGRSMHMALQWFGMSHPEYDFFWNWEMDMRYVGHWYELFDRVSGWAERQPRRGLWERSGRFYIPSAHGEWHAFVDETERRAKNGPGELIHGPQTFSGWEGEERTGVFGENYRGHYGLPSPAPSTNEDPSSQWGIGEPADYISFLPLFNPASTFWNIRADVSGYDTSLPIPPRRASIVTASRFSHRLLTIMHKETSLARHSMCGEMFPASMSLHYGLKAVFAPHPVYFNRPLERLRVCGLKCSTVIPPQGRVVGMVRACSVRCRSIISGAVRITMTLGFRAGCGGDGLDIGSVGREGRVTKLGNTGVEGCV